MEISHPLDKYEKTFSEFAEFRGFRLQQIPRQQQLRLPDFLIQKEETEFFAEITHIEDEDAGKERATNSKLITVGKKLRSVLDGKRKQIKNGMSKYNCPSLLMIYDLGYRSVTMHEDVSALFGDRTLIIGKDSGRVLDSFYGKNSKLREDLNQELSAICIGRWRSIDELNLLAYHNPYATHPFEKGFFKNHFDITEMYYEIST